MTSGQDFGEIGFEVQSSGGMGMKKHTPGPWEVCEPETVETLRHIVSSKYYPEGATVIERPPQSRNEAMETFFQAVVVGHILPDDAQLIAASPDLLAACEKFAAAMRSGEKPDFLKLVEALHEADSAIAKATGATP